MLEKRTHTTRSRAYQFSMYSRCPIEFPHVVCVSQNVCPYIRAVFDKAYCDIRYMLEANILHIFTETEEFKEAANPAEQSLPRCKKCCIV